MPVRCDLGMQIALAGSARQASDCINGKLPQQLTDAGIVWLDVFGHITDSAMHNINWPLHEEGPHLNGHLASESQAT